MFFFNQRTAYEMRISDWSADVCSSDLDLQHVATLPLLRERSQLDSLGFHLSDEKFTVAEATWGMLHTDRRFHGVDIRQVALRKSIRDDSREQIGRAHV